MFTKEHYIEIAKILKKNKLSRFSMIVEDFVELFRGNPKFDKETFLDEIYRKEVKL